MLYFRLLDENTEGELGFWINFDNVDDYYDFMDKPRSEDFLINYMEYRYGVHDIVGDGDNNIVGFSSYEITNFEGCLEDWRMFFEKYDKLVID